MPTRTAPGLSADELARIRDTLAAGRKPRVVFRPGAGDQMAGQVGQVVKLTDPEASDDWVVVRFRGDDLPFSPADLEIPSKSKATAPAAPAVEPVSATLPGPREEPSVATSTTANATANGAGRPVKGAKAAPPPAVADPSVDPPVDSAADRAAEKAAVVKKAAAEPVAKAEPEAAPVAPSTQAAKPARKAAKPKAPPSLTVTLTYSEGEWMVGATQGSKSLAKPYVIKPAEALKMVSMLDVPGVHEAVEEIVSAARAEAEQQAERLRAELAEIEARLAELSETE